VWANPETSQTFQQGDMGMCNRVVALCFLLLAAGAVARDSVPNAAMQRVIGMLDKLVADMGADQKVDDKMFSEFSAWCTKQKEATSSSIEELQATLEELGAKLSGLYAQKTELETVIASLNHQIEETQTQMQIATEKRGEERNSYLTEQQNFDASIAACGKAVEVLKAHYGEPAKAAEKPAWMSLVQEAAGTLRKAVAHHKMKVHSRLMAFLMAPRYEGGKAEAGGIVEQMQELSDTFASDKQSSTDEENKLQDMYNKLMQEKQTLLSTLIAERDSRQTVLNQVTEDIATTEGAKLAAENELKDEQAYLAQVNKSCADAKALYEMRSHDRVQETTAVNEAVKILEPQAGSALVEVDRSLRVFSSADKTVKRSGGKLRGAACKGCQKAATLLMQAARTYNSQMLATAAAAATSNEALQDIIAALDGLIKRLHEDQKVEDNHKEWCEKELSENTMRKAKHEGLVATLTATIADLTETINEKVQALQDNADAIQLADKNFAEATAIRGQDKSEFETELGNYVEALSALNQAIDVLAKFYASKKAAAAAAAGAALVQVGHRASQTKVAPREVAPGMFAGAAAGGGKGVVDMISVVRTEFETGKRDLEAAEKQAQADYDQAREDYQEARRGLVSQGDKLTVEKQTAENAMEQAREDKATNEEEVAAATSYLAQLGGSCNTLLKNHAARKQQRTEEEQAISDAKKVLEEEA